MAKKKDSKKSEEASSPTIVINQPAQKSGSKTCLTVILILAILGVLSFCCCGGLVVCGIVGYLPEAIQEEYDTGDWFWDDLVDEYIDETNSGSSTGKGYPNGDVSDWWWSASEKERKAFIDDKSYPYGLYEFNWDSPSFLDTVSAAFEGCDHPNGEISSWWYTTTSDIRSCYVLNNGLPTFLYGGGNWDSSKWKKDNNCGDHPNGDIEYWWFESSDSVKDCFTWENGAPLDLYGYDFIYDENGSSYYSEPTCLYELDCDHPNGDVDLWFDDVSEEKKACFVYEYMGDSPFWAEGGCSYPNGDVEDWWCSVDEDVRLCYLWEYGLPWFMG